MLDKLKYLFLWMLVTTPAQAAQGDYVVLLHGLARDKTNMQKIEKHFTAKGYQVINLDYDSREKPVEKLVHDVAQMIKKRAIDKNKKIHFVTHSMGGLVARGYIHQYRPENLGRVVMLGPPNQGSEVASWLQNNWLYKKYYGAAGQQLVKGLKPLDGIIGESADYELGIIAGTRSIDPVSSLFVLSGQDDGKVTVKATKLTGMTDHITLPVTHTFMMKNKTVIQQAVYFIRTGTFKRSPAR